MATAVEILTEARRLIAEVGWTQGAYARNECGEDVGTAENCASSFCSSGAIMRACPIEDNWCEFEERLSEAIEEFVPHWNDASGRTKAEVLAAFDKAIALAKSEQQP